MPYIFLYPCTYPEKTFLFYSYFRFNYFPKVFRTLTGKALSEGQFKDKRNWEPAVHTWSPRWTPEVSCPSNRCVATKQRFLFCLVFTIKIKLSDILKLIWPIPIALIKLRISGKDSTKQKCPKATHSHAGIKDVPTLHTWPTSLRGTSHSPCKKALHTSQAFLSLSQLTAVLSMCTWRVSTYLSDTLTLVKDSVHCPRTAACGRHWSFCVRIAFQSLYDEQPFLLFTYTSTQYFNSFSAPYFIERLHLIEHVSSHGYV